MSKDKSAFVCSDGEITKALRAMLKADDPKVVSVVKDLGVDAAGCSPEKSRPANRPYPKSQQKKPPSAETKSAT